MLLFSASQYISQAGFELLAFPLGWLDWSQMFSPPSSATPKAGVIGMHHYTHQNRAFLKDAIILFLSLVK